jgi:TolB-like protein/predicted Zn-dependent protease
MGGIISELRRRNVVRTGAAYLAGSWLLLQVVETLVPVFGFGNTFIRFFVIVLIIGFIPTLVFSWAFEWTPEGFKRDQDTSPDDQQAKAQARTWDRIILVVMALALGLFAFDRFVLSPQREAQLIELATEAGAEMERAKVSTVVHESVAVLPFANMSADPANEYFSDGLTETLLHMLAQFSDLKVAARTSSFAFKDKNEDIRVIAAALSVAHVLEGSVQKFGNRVRVTAQLIRAADGYHIWSHNYDRELDDIFAIQDEISADVASALGTSLLADSESPIIGVFTDDVTAYDIFLQALEQQARGTFESLAQAERLFKESLARDPSFVDAKLALVRNSYLKMRQGASDLDVESPAMRLLIDEMLAANPGDLAARQYDLRLRSNIAINDMELPKYHELMQELFLLFQEGDGNPHIRAQTAIYLANNERLDDALDLMHRGLINDPLNVDLLTSQAYLFSIAGRLDDAEQPLLTALELQPRNPTLLWYLGSLEIGRKDILRGLDYWRRTELADPNDPRPTSEIALTFTEIGMYDYSERWKASLRSRTSNIGRIAAVDVQTAAERGDEDALRKIVPGAIDKMFKGEFGGETGSLLLREYVNIMIDDGQARAALDYIETYHPGVSDIANNAAGDWETLRLQKTAVLPLLKEIEDESAYRQAVEAFAANWRESGINLDEGTWNHFWMEYHVNGLDAGKKAFFQTFDEDRYILAWHWHSLMRERWTAELRADPDVAAVVMERQARVAELGEQMKEIVKRPLWQEQ